MLIRWMATWLLTLMPVLALSDDAPATWRQVTTQQATAADLTVAYGGAADQFAELRLPAGTGPHPVVVLLHGGCWLPNFDLAHIRPLAEAITGLGYATWNVEYRRPGEEQDGWPQTFVDASTAVDRLRTLADRFHLDLGQVTLLGHSAGGQLALWLAARPRFAADHALYVSDPLPVGRALALAPITDMASYAAGAEEGCPVGARRVLGGLPEEWPERYRAVNPIDNLPGPIRVDLVHAIADRIVPLEHSELFAQRMNASGGKARIHHLESPAGHFDVLLTDGAAWDRLEALLTD